MASKQIVMGHAINIPLVAYFASRARVEVTDALLSDVNQISAVFAARV